MYSVLALGEGKFTECSNKRWVDNKRRYNPCMLGAGPKVNVKGQIANERELT